MAALFDLPWIPFYLLIVFLIHPWLGILALAGAGVVTALALANQAMTKKPLKRAMGMDGAESFFVEQSRQTAEALAPLGMIGAISARWRRMHDAGLVEHQSGGDRSEGFTASSKAFRMLLQSTLLALGGYLALSQEISAGMIVGASIIAGRALAPVDQVIGQWRNLVRAREAWLRLKQTLDGVGFAETKIELPTPEGRIVLRGVTKYPPDAPTGQDVKPILDGVSFSLEPGEGLGVIGPSASGKSTLARILVGAWHPEAGECRLDGATADQWAGDDLGRHLGYLPQQLQLLAGSVRDNIARFQDDVPDEDVITAATRAGVHDLILKLPNGYATEIGYGRSALSGGQVQRIGLARALFREPKLIVLDEPNAHLDAAGDEALAQAIRSMRELGSTVVVMAHRPSALAAVNKALVLQEGRVAEFGDKEQVMRKFTRPAAVSKGRRIEQAG